MKKRISFTFMIVILLFGMTLIPVLRVSAVQSVSGNFNPANLTGDPATDMVAVAAAQANRTEAQMGYNEPWCADFISDCAKITGQSEAIPFNGTVKSLYNAVINAGGQRVSSPRAGDLLFYYCNTESAWTHVALMKSSTLSIQGNVGHKVYDDFKPGNYKDGMEHRIGSGLSAIYVRPNYKPVIDTTPPTISKISFSEITSDGFKYSYVWKDNIGVVKERIILYAPNKSYEKYYYDHPVNSNTYTTTRSINWKDFLNGNYYLAITQWDAAGNETTVYSDTLTRNYDTTPPQISNVSVSDISDIGYTVSCNVYDNVGISFVTFRVYIESSDGTISMEDYNGTINGNTASAHIYAFEKNAYYHTYIISKDNSGNEVQVSPDDFPCLKVYIKEKVQEVEYRVIHYKEKLDGEYSKANDETFKAKPGTNVTPDTKSYTGFSSPSAKTVSVEADGTTIVKYYYTRNSYTLTWQLEGGTASGSYTEGTVKYGTTITAPTVEKEGYELAGWSTSVPETMPAENLTIIAKWELAGKRETEAFVTRFYKTILGRDPDKPGLDNWVNSLISGERTAADVARGFVLSQEFLNQNVSNAEFVRRMYTAFLDRSALDDQPGYDHWIDFLNAGCSREYVVAEFIKSVEFGNLCKQYKIQAGELNADNGAPTRPTSYPKLKVDSSRVNDQELTIYVARLYRVILGREASGYEIESWKETIKTGREYDAASVASAFFMSTEYMSKHKSNKDFTADCYKAFFDRDPRGTPEKIYYDDWVRKLDVGEISRTQMIEYGFGQSQEFKNLLTSFGFRIIE